MDDRKSISEDQEPAIAGFVSRSSPDSIQTGTLSVQAVLEVPFAIALYYAFGKLCNYSSILWVSALVVPILLLRSPGSLEFGKRLLRQYVDREFGGVINLPGKTYRSYGLWYSVIFELVLAFAFAAILAKQVGSIHNLWAEVLMGLALGYAVLTITLAGLVAFATKEVIAVAERSVPGGLAAVALTGAAAAGLLRGGVSTPVWVSAAFICFVLAAIAMARAPSVVANAMKRARQNNDNNVTGQEFAKAIIDIAPREFAVFIPGFCLGSWLRCVWIRIYATVVYLKDGFSNMPKNYWQALFVVDLNHLPEFVPGYDRSDAFNPSYLRDRISLGNSITEKIYLIFFYVFLSLPAYLYRLCIKSTCWLYFPFIYLAKSYGYSRHRLLLNDLVWRNPREWITRLVSICVIVGIIYSNYLEPDRIKSSLPEVLVSPIEYLFVVDYQNLKIWTWSALLSALFTLVIAWIAMPMGIYLRHSSSDSEVEATIARNVWWLERLFRARTFFSMVFAVIVLTHIILWSMQKWIGPLPDIIVDLLRFTYGEAMPLPDKPLDVSPAN